MTTAVLQWRCVSDWSHQARGCGIKWNSRPEGRNGTRPGPITRTVYVSCDKAYPNLDDVAKETLALKAYLSRLTDPQFAFNVKQRTPRDLNEATTATNELELYLPASVTSVSSVEGQETGPKNETSVDRGMVAAVSATERLATMVDTLTKRIETLEASHGPSREDQHASRRSDETTCPDEK